MKKGRFDLDARSEFNMWLKEMGISVEVTIGKNLRKYPNNYGFVIGKGMFDFITGKYRGLDTSSEDLVALGIDLKQVIELEKKDHEKYKSYKEQSLKSGRDIRFPRGKKCAVI